MTKFMKKELTLEEIVEKLENAGISCNIFRKGDAKKITGFHNGFNYDPSSLCTDIEHEGITYTEGRSFLVMEGSQQFKCLTTIKDYSYELQYIVVDQMVKTREILQNLF